MRRATRKITTITEAKALITRLSVLVEAQKDRIAELEQRVHDLGQKLDSKHHGPH